MRCRKWLVLPTYNGIPFSLKRYTHFFRERSAKIGDLNRSHLGELFERGMETIDVACESFVHVQQPVRDWI